MSEPREVKLLVVHCSATPPTMHVDAALIDRWHRERGWRGIGYHYVIKRNGTIENGRSLETVGAHVEGHNAESIGICLAGGVDNRMKPDNNFAPEQMQALSVLLFTLSRMFPSASVVGHRDLDPKKACPSFDVKSWWRKQRTQ